MATAGQDGTVKVWDCRNWKGAVRTWNARGGGAILDWSQKGALGVATGGSVNVRTPRIYPHLCPLLIIRLQVYTKPSIQTPFAPVVPPPLYITHPVPHRPLTSLRFCPFQDILTIGHSAGVSNILVPGSGEPNFDSSEADPFENKKARREREVKNLLDKIQPDAIALDPDFIGSLAPTPKLSTAVDGAHNIPYSRLPRHERLRVAGKADETEEVDDDAMGVEDENGDGQRKRPLTKADKEKKKMRGKNKTLKRYLRKQRKNVIDPRAVSAGDCDRCTGRITDSHILGRRADEARETKRRAAESPGDREWCGAAAQTICFGPLQATKLSLGHCAYVVLHVLFDPFSLH